MEAAVEFSPTRLATFEAALEPSIGIGSWPIPWLKLSVVKRRHGISKVAGNLPPSLPAVADCHDHLIAPAAQPRVARALALMLAAGKEITTRFAAAPSLSEDGCVGATL